MIGVILANTGSPAAPDPDSIEQYLREYLMDERIRQLPKPMWKYLLHKHILPKRKNTSAERYRFIWTEEGSPLVVNAKVLAQKVQRLLDAEADAGAAGTRLIAPTIGRDTPGDSLDVGRDALADSPAIGRDVLPGSPAIECDASGDFPSVGHDASGDHQEGEAVASDVQKDAVAGRAVMVLSAMSYGEPSLADALSQLRNAGADRVVLLPLYPQSAFSPTMAVVDAFWRAQDAIGWHPESQVIDNYHDDAGYIAAIARSIHDAGFDASSDDRLVLSFHAIPLKDEAAGDTYRTQIAESVRLIAEQLGVSPESIVVSFQSVFGHDKSKWTSPLSLDLLESWRDEAFRVVYACPGFSIDCLETMYDIPNEMVPALEGDDAKPVVERVADGDIQASCNTNGRFVWVPTLNTSDEHAELLKSVLDKHIAVAK